MEFSQAFFEVKGYSHLQYRKLDLFDSSGNKRGPIGSQSGLSFSRLHDSNGDDIARVGTDENAWQLSHFSVSVLNPDIRVYPRIPATEPHPAWSWAVGGEPDPSNGSEYGFVSGERMNWEDPPAELQTVAFQSGDRSQIQYGFYNENPNIQISPSLNVLGRTYRVSPITQEKEQNQVLKEAMEEDSPSEVITLSGVTDTVTFTYPEEWEEAGAVQTTQLALSEMEAAEA
jgi:hypothetical protein